MESGPVSAVTELLVNILIGTFSLASLSWVLIGVRTFIDDCKREKREQERDRRDAEYHLKRMKELDR